MKKARQPKIKTGTAMLIRALLPRVVVSLSEHAEVLRALDPDTARDLKVAAAQVKRDKLKHEDKMVRPVNAQQLFLGLRDPMQYQNPATRRPCQYPYEAVKEARKMRKHGYFYREIASALFEQYGIKVSLFTVRDWIENSYRVKS